jgi:hypothetical protein
MSLLEDSCILSPTPLIYLDTFGVGFVDGYEA